MADGFGQHAPSLPAARPAVLGALVLWLAVASTTGLLLWRERSQAVAEAMQDAVTLSAVLEENTARTFDAVDVALQGLASWLGRSESGRHDPQVRELMRAQLRHLPTVRALFVIGPDGYIRHDTDFPRTPDVSLADRPYFRQYLASGEIQHALSPALQSRSGTGWFVASTRRVTDPAGNFRGIVVAAVQLDTVSKLFHKLQLAPGQVMSLLQEDGRLIASFPSDDASIGRDYGGLSLFKDRLPTQPVGVLRADGPPLGYARVVSYRRLESQPLVVVLSTAESTVLAGWRRAAFGAAAALAVFTTLLVLGAWLYVQQRQQKARALAHQAAEADLRAADRMKGEFLATLSHELRNVLAPLQNGMTILERVDHSTPQAHRTRAMMQRQLAQMRHLVDDLLEVSRLNSGKVRLVRERQDLRTLLAAAAEAAHAFMETPGHRLEMSFGPEPLWVEVDRGRMLQVLANLLGNAAKYTPPGGHIRLCARRDGQNAVVDVVDNGIGIPLAAQARVFEMFEQVRGHLAHSQGGLGIGLSLVQKLVALHGGHVQARSEGPNLGSTFTVSLPLALESAGVAPAPNASDAGPVPI